MEQPRTLSEVVFQPWISARMLLLRPLFVMSLPLDNASFHKAQLLVRMWLEVKILQGLDRKGRVSLLSLSQ